MKAMRDLSKDRELIDCTFKPSLAASSESQNLRVSKNTCSKSTGLGLTSSA